MRASDLCFEIIKYFEDFRKHPYVCSGGMRTIGYGHAIVPGDKYSVPIRTLEAKSLLFDDVVNKEKVINSLLVSTVVLRQYQWDALVSFAYNVKETLFRRSTLMRLINEGKTLLAE
jgi:lysozyme